MDILNNIPKEVIQMNLLDESFENKIKQEK